MRYIVTNLKEPCNNCTRLTDLFEINLEQRICSEECFKKVKANEK
ncbi:Uncharacterised protein [[Clostridium] sordellii]|nr:hypothetical protein [Paeniclostridium sordellii]CEQ01637.1 Uncharacterised protein [[Clostridium] sordellii] [Paeniclostridium sordellii]